MRVPQVGQVYAYHEQFGCSCGAGPWGFPPELQMPWHESMTLYPWTCPSCGRMVRWQPGIQVVDTWEPGDSMSWQQRNNGVFK